MNACVALTGRSTIDQHALFLLGLGSSGKSNLMKITQAAIECYFKEIAGNIFTKGNRELSKLLNTYSIEPYIRVSWINEPSDTKMDGPVFKRFCVGDNQTVRLYSDGCFTFKHHSCITATANTMPQIIIDSGTSRRIKSYTHKSKFTNNKDEVNEELHVYAEDKDILDNTIKKQKLQLPWFHILAEYAKQWLKDKSIEYTDNFKETTEMVIMTNDIMQDFIDGTLILTKNEK